MARKLMVVLAVVVLSQAQPDFAAGHSWYPHDCCHDGDCAPVETILRFLPAGGGAPQFRVTSKFGTVIIPRGFPMQDSPDGRMHVCMTYGPFGDLQVRCVFAPPSM